MACDGPAKKTKQRSRKRSSGCKRCCAETARQLASIYGFDATEALGKLGLHGKTSKAKRSKSPRKQSAYMRFCAKERSKLPKLSPTDTMKELGKRWRSLSDADKKNI